MRSCLVIVHLLVVFLSSRCNVGVVVVVAGWVVSRSPRRRLTAWSGPCSTTTKTTLSTQPGIPKVLNFSSRSPPAPPCSLFVFVLAIKHTELMRIHRCFFVEVNKYYFSMIPYLFFSKND